MKFKNLLSYYKDISKTIEKKLLIGDLEDIQPLLEEYHQNIDDAEIYSQKAIFSLQKNEMEKAIKTLKTGFIKHPFNYAINYNLGFLLAQTRELSESLKYFVYALKYSESNEEQQQAVEQIEYILSNNQDLVQKYNEYKTIIQEGDGRIYPLDKNGNSLIRKIIKKDDSDQFMINMYDSNYVTDIKKSSRLFFKTELIKGKESFNKEIISLESSAIIPISLIHPQTDIDILLDGQKSNLQLKHLNNNKFHYLNFDTPDKLTFKSNKNIFVGNPINKTKGNIPGKLVIKIFIDGLSMEFLEQYGIDKLLPNTHKFFQGGFISKNCYATSEWTLPCKASINTGNYSTSHKLLHPTFNYAFENHNKLMAEYFCEAGYYTTNICSNWRTTPTFGYYKGFERIVYQNFLGGMDCKQVVSETIEHLESFRNVNNFLSISIMDLHNVPDEIENHLLAEVNTELEHRLDTHNKGVTSVQTKYDKAKIHKYALEIKRVDVYLGILFDYISKKYKDDDIVIALHSDHGQTFLEDEEILLHDSRTKIPFMIKGKDVTNKDENEIIEMIDILPIILKSSGLAIPNSIDGRLPKTFGGNEERKYALTQVIHPNQPYSAIINDDTHYFYFETKNNVNNDLSICIENYSSILVEKESKKDVTHLYNEKVQMYENLIFNHIKDFIRWKE